MSRAELTLREVLLADMYQKEIDALKKDVSILREALERIASIHADIQGMVPPAVRYAREALQRAGGGE